MYLQGIRPPNNQTVQKVNFLHLPPSSINNKYLELEQIAKNNKRAPPIGKLDSHNIDMMDKTKFGSPALNLVSSDPNNINNETIKLLQVKKSISDNVGTRVDRLEPEISKIATIESITPEIIKLVESLETRVGKTEKDRKLDNANIAFAAAYGFLPKMTEEEKRKFEKQYPEAAALTDYYKNKIDNMPAVIRGPIVSELKDIAIALDVIKDQKGVDAFDMAQLNKKAENIGSVLKKYSMAQKYKINIVKALDKLKKLNDDIDNITEEIETIELSKANSQLDISLIDENEDIVYDDKVSYITQLTTAIGEIDTQLMENRRILNDKIKEASRIFDKSGILNKTYFKDNILPILENNERELLILKKNLNDAAIDAEKKGRDPTNFLNRFRDVDIMLQLNNMTITEIEKAISEMTDIQTKTKDKIIEKIKEKEKEFPREKKSNTKRKNKNELILIFNEIVLSELLRVYDRIERDKSQLPSYYQTVTESGNIGLKEYIDKNYYDVGISPEEEPITQTQEGTEDNPVTQIQKEPYEEEEGEEFSSISIQEEPPIIPPPPTTTTTTTTTVTTSTAPVMSPVKKISTSSSSSSAPKGASAGFYKKNMSGVGLFNRQNYKRRFLNY